MRGTFIISKRSFKCALSPSSAFNQYTGSDRASYVQTMFSRLAKRYNRANRWMTFGQDLKWRRKVISLANLPPGGKLLDIGTGTGDLALEALRRDGSLKVVGGDFTIEMLRQGQAAPGGERVRWACTDALNLPFPDASFDSVVSGYLLRNVSDIAQAWREQYRVLKPGGRAVCLDTTPPRKDLLHLPVRLYLRWGIPLIGRIIAGDAEAYTYLPKSTRQFLTAEALAQSMRAAGFQEVGFQRLMLGTMAIHWGTR